jgi:alpha-amylase
MDKVNFLIGMHNHQPIGNFDFVFEKAYRKSYLPFLEVMERHPKLRWNLHITGILSEWLDKNHPEYMDRIAEQVQSGRVELLTGGFYEPILPALPDADKIGQILKQTRYIEKRFKTTPKGMWLAERVWEPHLPKVLRETGVEYTLLDDAHFMTTGMTPDQMVGAYLTEEQGATLAVLPIRKDLRYAIPFRDPQETINLLRQNITPNGSRALVIFDDGEKFGLWPETYKHVYEDGWLEKFLRALEANSDWLVCSRISDYLASNGTMGRVYLPTASYYEMGEWTLPAASQAQLSGLLKEFDAKGTREEGKTYLRGGFWRNFLTKYEESNHIHKRMMAVGEKVHKAVDKLLGIGEKIKADKLLGTFWASQCNCAYWHGVFGGLYLPHLRQALYNKMLKAEISAERVLDTSMPQVIMDDFNKDGRREVVIETAKQNLFFSPHNGGALIEWDLRSLGVNLLNVLTRRKEGYHQQLLDYRKQQHIPRQTSGVKTIHDMIRVKEMGLEKRLHVDWYQRSSLRDHFLHADTSLDSFFRCQYGEQGDFVLMPYDVDFPVEKMPAVHLSRQGTVWSGDQRNGICVEKTINVTSPLGIEVLYRVRNMEGPACSIWFGSEMVFAFSGQDIQDPVDHGRKSTWLHRDQGFGFDVQMQLERPMDLWEFPLETVSLSEEGFERTYQGSVLLAHSRISLKPQQVDSFIWKLEIIPQ